MDIVSLIPVLVAIITGGGVALYTARPQKDSIIAAASEKAVSVVTQAIARLEAENTDLRARVGILEGEVATFERLTVNLRREVEQMKKAAHEVD